MKRTPKAKKLRKRADRSAGVAMMKKLADEDTLQPGEGFVGYTDKDGNVKWEPVKFEWREVRPAVRKPKRKAS